MNTNGLGDFCGEFAHQGSFENYVQNSKLVTFKPKRFEFFLNNTNLTFLAFFLTKLTMRVSKKFQ